MIVQQKRTTKLKFKEEKVFRLDHDELDRFIAKVYGLKDFSVVMTEEASNDSTLSFAEISARKQDEYDLEMLDNFKQGINRRFFTHVILNDLCIQGLIPPGDYIVDVCW